MEHNNGGGSSITDNLSSSSSSCSNHFEVDIGEDDAAFYELEEDDSASVVLNSGSPSMMSTLPQTYDMDTVYGAIKQSPPVQLMGQPPSPMFSLKHRSNSGWSLGSCESLFSIRTGNNSLSKSGDLNWLDDKSCMSSGLPTVMDTSAENERMSDSTNSEPDEKEETIDTQREKGNLSASFSTNSFAFPVLDGRGPSPTKVEAEKQNSAPSTPPAEAAQTTPKAPNTATKAGCNQWFNCFSCFPMCC